MRERGPPRLAPALLAALLPRSERDFVLGDLQEEFHRRRSGSGRLRAVVWYWGEAARSAWPRVTYSMGGGEGAMTGWGEDLRGALRVFTRAPAFAAVVVVTLAIGIGCAAAVYSVLAGVVLAPLPFEESERVVMLWGRSAEYPRTPLTVGDHNELVHGVEAFAGVAAQWSNTTLILGEGAAEQVSVGWVTPEYFDVLRIRPALGRGLGPDDRRPS